MNAINSCLLEVKDLRKRYKNSQIEAVKGVSFSIQSGQVFGLLGPNGAGKTTIINSITTLEKPSQGEVLVCGIDTHKLPTEGKRQFGVVHQEVIHSGFFSVQEILEFMSGYYGIKNNQAHIKYLLHKLSLTQHKDKKVKQLSGGMKRRLMIAKALIHSPKLLLLDEPTAGVDIQLREDLWAFVRELRSQGVGILLTTHYLEEAEALCDEVAILNQGQLIESGNTQDVIKKYTQRKVTFVTREDLKVESALPIKNIEPGVFEVTVPHGLVVGEVIRQSGIATHEILDIKIEEGNLSNAFMSVLSKGDNT